ncbi:MAG TPA: SAM-dependent methyltransferase [Polyangiaceae bacterium]|nr:SAM-dependent methyltransferase [Polyangiaceae bacterium]
MLTSYPGRLYDGEVLEQIGLESLEYLMQELARLLGPIELGACRMGVFTWDIACRNADGPFTVQLPLAMDRPGRRGRSKAEVPRLNLEHTRYFRERGLRRFVVEPREYLTLGGNVPAAIFGALPEHHPVLFGCGAAQIEVSEGQQAWRVRMGSATTAELLAEMIAALVYHYEPELDGGTTLADVCVNDGDFVARRRPDGSFELRLLAARQRESGVPRNRLLLYLIQWMAYEDWVIDGNLVGLPVLISNPAVTFHGVLRGLRYRYRDLGQDEADAERDGRQWIFEFGRSREGRAYRPWVERFLDLDLPLQFGRDPREHWWRLIPLQTKLGLLELRARQAPNSAEVSSAGALRAFLERISREIGVRWPEHVEQPSINDLDREALGSLMSEVGIVDGSRREVADALIQGWPYRNFEQVLRRAGDGRALRKLKGRIAFGHVVPSADQGTLKSLPGYAKPPSTRLPSPRANTSPTNTQPASAMPVSAMSASEPSRPPKHLSLANPELYSVLPLAKGLESVASSRFPSFEAYMDAALHDATWGYYSRHVVIGPGGHFETNPEALSPNYGRWVAAGAFRCWSELCSRAKLDSSEIFPVVEFGAGNGRLARDFLDAVTHHASDPENPQSSAWRRFADRMRYRIYEMSSSLRERQRELLGASVVVGEGDARHPLRTLNRDFPEGLRGFVVTNEVPDAFGVHKVLLTSAGAFVALVVPRAAPALGESMPSPLAERLRRVDQELRNSFSWHGHAEDLYMDHPTWSAVMAQLSESRVEARDTLLDRLWFEECYVPVRCVPELHSHVVTNAVQYATALAAEDSGVVTYVNLHAERFIRELGSSLCAGSIVTIDYGDTTWNLIQGGRRGEFPFRIYKDDPQEYAPRPNDPYSAPGTQDMTADVNFTALALAGQSAGLEILHFGPERDVSGAELTEVLKAAADQPVFAKFLGNPVFKVLVLGAGVSNVFSGPLMSELPLVHSEQALPKSRRSLIAEIVQALVA